MVALDGERAAIMDVQTMAMTPYVLTYKAPRIEADLMGFIKPCTYTVSAGELKAGERMLANLSLFTCNI